MDLQPGTVTGRILAVMAAMTMLCGSASAQIASIETPGGPVKVRQQASQKAKQLMTIPNHAFVEAGEEDNGWYEVTYKGKTGYVSGKFVRTYEEQESDAFSVKFSAEEITVGSIVDITVEGEGIEACRYTVIYADGKKAAGEKCPYTATSFRPKKSGVAVLDVEAWFANGKSEKVRRILEITETGKKTAAEKQDGLIIYSQKDGSWNGVKYGRSDLETSGCALFSMAHAVQLMGFDPAVENPTDMAKKFGYCVAQGGTVVPTLMGAASRKYKFKTEEKKIDSARKLASHLKNGSMFIFSVATGHIALATELSEDGTKVRVIDSAPTATITRLKNDHIYIEDGDGWHAVSSLDEISGSRYFFETDSFGGLSYWMDLSYLAKRGGRLIRP